MSGSSNNFFLGENAGANASSSVLSCVGIGDEACKNLSDAQNSTFVGRSAGLGAAGATDCVAIGDYSAGYMTGATQNTLVGLAAGGNIASAQLNVGVGSNAMRDANQAQRNAVAGTLAARVLTGDDNAIVGHGAAELSTLYRGTVIGAGAASPLPFAVSQPVVIGYQAAASTLSTPPTCAVGDNSVLVGAWASKDAQTPPANAVLVGAGAGAQDAAGLLAVSGSSLSAVAVGALAGATPAGRAASALAPTCCRVGYQAGYDASPDSDASVAVGAGALASSSGCPSLVAIGPGSGRSYTAGGSTVLVGDGCGGDGASQGPRNAVVGSGAGVQGHDNALVGTASAAQGSTNVVVGSGLVVAGSDSTVVGTSLALANAALARTTVVGRGVTLYAPSGVSDSTIVGAGLTVTANEGQALSGLCVLGSGQVSVSSARGAGLVSLVSASGSYLSAYGDGGVTLRAAGALALSAAAGLALDSTPLTVTVPAPQQSSAQPLTAVTTSVPTPAHASATFLCNGRVAGRVFHPDGMTTCYGTTSDRRAKRIVGDVQPGAALETLERLRVRWYRFLDSAGDAPAKMGFIADEVQDVVPEAVHGDRGDPGRLQVLDMAKLVPLMVASIQQLRAEVLQLRRLTAP